MMGNLIIHPLVFLDPALLVLLQAQRSMMDGSSTVPTTRRQVRIIGSAEQRGTRKTAFLLTDPNSLCFFFFETRWIPIPIPDPQLHPRSHAWAWCIHVAVSLDDPCWSQTRNNHLPVEYATIMTFNPSLSFPKLHGLNMSGFRHSETVLHPERLNLLGVCWYNHKLVRASTEQQLQLLRESNGASRQVAMVLQLLKFWRWDGRIH